MTDVPTPDQLAAFLTPQPAGKRTRQLYVDGEHRCAWCKEPMHSEHRSRVYHPLCLPDVQQAGKAVNRRCKRCKTVRAPSAFSDDLSRADGKFPWCKICQTEYATSAKFQDEDGPLNGRTCPMDGNPIRGSKNRLFCSNTCKHKVASLRDQYNLTPEQFKAMVAACPEGRCPICKKRPTVWHIDHNHGTMDVTGVVCTMCNTGALAWTYHDIEFVRRLLAYLEETPANQLGIFVKANPLANRPSGSAYNPRKS